MHIAVVSDTHQLGSGWGSPPEMLEALRGADLILHCGDLDTLGVLDHLETVAPVLAVRGYNDPHERGERLAEGTRVVEVAGVRIGVVHDLQWPGPPVRFTHTLEFPPGPVPQLMERKFGRPVDVVCFGDTHETYIGWHQGMLFLNPGSPTYPGLRYNDGDLGTVAYLDISNGVASAEICRLRRNSRRPCHRRSEGLRNGGIDAVLEVLQKSIDSSRGCRGHSPLPGSLRRHPSNSKPTEGGWEEGKR